MTNATLVLPRPRGVLMVLVTRRGITCVDLRGVAGLDRYPLPQED